MPPRLTATPEPGDQTMLPADQVLPLFARLWDTSDYAVLLGGHPGSEWGWMGARPRRVWRLDASGFRVWERGQDKARLLLPAEMRLLLPAEALAEDPSCLWPVLREAVGEDTVLGFLGYEFYRHCDPAWRALTPPPPDEPLLCLVAFDWLWRYEPSKDAWCFLGKETAPDASFAHPLSATPAVPAPLPDVPAALADATGYAAWCQDWRASLLFERFEADVARIQRQIAAGEIYQANLSLALEKTLRPLDPIALYQTLLAENPSPYCGLMKTPDGVLVSNSPERLLWAEGRELETRPIAGTRGRGKTPEDDARLADELSGDEKERAEHLMLVDLLRNDLGRVSLAGSVTVSRLLAVERYQRVMHLVSDVQGTLRRDLDYWDALASVFPGGTITGCPKIRCVEILNAIEPVPRGFYTGSLGVMTPETMDWNILIRSLWLSASPLGYNARIHVGAGIVADSVAAREYRECLRKAESMRGALYAHDRS